MGRSLINLVDQIMGVPSTFIVPGDGQLGQPLLSELICPGQTVDACLDHGFGADC